MHEDPTASGVTDRSVLGASVQGVRARRRDAPFGGICPTFLGLPGGTHFVTATFSAGSNRLLLFELASLTDPGGGSAPLSPVAEARLPTRLGFGRAVLDGVLDTLRGVFTLQRPWTDLFRALRNGVGRIFRDTSGGAYMFLETEGSQVWVVVPVEMDRDGPGYERGDSALLRFEVVGGTLQAEDPVILTDLPRGDTLVAALPFWPTGGPGGPAARTWYVTRRGQVGLVGRPGSGFTLQAPLQLPTGERIQNSFAVNQRGAFVVSNRALYRIELTGGTLQVVWRRPYDRMGGPPKPGQIDSGSGTTPTLVGDDWVAICDGAEQMKLAVYRQDDGTLAASEVVFPSAGRKSACESSVVGVAWDDPNAPPAAGSSSPSTVSFLVGNTYGYVHPFDTHYQWQGGLARLDLHPANPTVLTRRWDQPFDVMGAPPKLSIADGRLYCYARKPPIRGGFCAWFRRRTWALQGIDLRTGSLDFEVETDSGRERQSRHPFQLIFRDRPDAFDNCWASFTVLSDGSVVVALWEGFLRIYPGPSSTPR
jgi:hypothetical protein